jgi:hypothetical protein
MILATAISAVLIAAIAMEGWRIPGLQPGAVTAPVPYGVYQANPQALPFYTLERTINVVFEPGPGYGDVSNPGNLQVFRNDIDYIITQGFYRVSVVVSNSTKYAFWYMVPRVNGAITDFSLPCVGATWPDETEGAAFGDAFVLLHRTPTNTDCALGKHVTSNAGVRSDPNLPGNSLALWSVHETSHAIYNIPDLYWGQGGYWADPPALYSSQADCLADPVNAGWRDCRPVLDTWDPNHLITWWRSEGEIFTIMSHFNTPNVQYGHAEWVIIKQVLSNLPYAGAINEPIALAPQTWP